MTPDELRALLEPRPGVWVSVDVFRNHAEALLELWEASVILWPLLGPQPSKKGEQIVERFIDAIDRLEAT